MSKVLLTRQIASVFLFATWVVEFEHNILNPTRTSHCHLPPPYEDVKLDPISEPTFLHYYFLSCFPCSS
jgi:hypothetical protein